MDGLALYMGTSQACFHAMVLLSQKVTSFPIVFMRTSAQEQNLKDVFKFLTTLETLSFERISAKNRFLKIPQTLFADHVTTSYVTGFSAFYLVHGVHPILPFDLAEATFMVDGFISEMTLVELIALRIRQLQRHPKNLEQAAETLKNA